MFVLNFEFQYNLLISILIALKKTINGRANKFKTGDKAVYLNY